MGAVLDSPWVQNPFRRRGAVVIAAIVLAVLCVWPRPYMARAQLLPNDYGGSLASLLGAAGGGGALALGALFGGHQSIESDVTITRSQAVLGVVVRRLRLEGRFRVGDICRWPTLRPMPPRRCVTICRVKSNRPSRSCLGRPAHR